jgi:hypothetical protein
MIGSDGQGNLQIPADPVRGVTDRARSLALGLYAKACKQFRGIIILGERGFGGEVTVLTRSLFETTLAMNLIMNESVALKRDGKTGSLSTPTHHGHSRRNSVRSCTARTPPSRKPSALGSGVSGRNSSRVWVCG